MTMLKLTIEREELNRLERELAEFRDSNFSHNSAEEFLRFKRESIESYCPIHLSAAYIAAKNDDDERIYQTELKSARKAIEKGCRYVTNLDYCINCIAGTGLLKK